MSVEQSAMGQMVLIPVMAKPNGVCAGRLAKPKANHPTYDATEADLVGNRLTNITKLCTILNKEKEVT